MMVLDNRGVYQGTLLTDRFSMLHSMCGTTSFPFTSDGLKCPQIQLAGQE